MGNSPERVLWLAVLARAVADILAARLTDEPEALAAEHFDTALQFVLKYPGIARRIMQPQSRQTLEEWLEELNKALEEV